MVDNDKLKRLSMREIIDYENACMLYMKYVENNTVPGDEYTLENDNGYGMVGRIRHELYKEILNRLERLCVKEK